MLPMVCYYGVSNHAHEEGDVPRAVQVEIYDSFPALSSPVCPQL